MIHVKFSSPALMGQPVRMTVTQGRVSRSLGIEAFGVAKTPPPLPPTLGGTGGATLTISARRGQQQIAPEGIAFFAEVSGFDAQKPTDGKVYDPTMHDIAYTWSFGDPGEFTAPVNILPEWKNRNVGYGPFPCHVFSAPGTYTVTCIATERSSGKSASASIQVTVQDPNAVFDASTTIVCAQGGNYAGAPAHDVANRVTTFSAALAKLASFKASGKMARILMRGGDTFEMTSSTYINSSYRNLHISAFGTGRATIQCKSSGAVFNCYSSLLTSGASISRLAMVGPWDSTTETVDPSFPAGAKRPDGVIVWGGFVTVHDCTGSGLMTNYSTGTEPGLTAIVSDCQAANWEDYGMYVGGENQSDQSLPLTGYVGITGCRFAQDPNALQGGNGKSTTDLGNRHGSLRFHAHAYHYLDAYDGFSRNGWTLAGGAPADQNTIRDHRNSVRSKAFFSRFMGEGGWQSYGNGAATGTNHIPSNAVIDKAYFMASARTVNGLAITGSAVTVRNAILHYPNVGTQFEYADTSIVVGDSLIEKFNLLSRTEPIKIYNVTIINEKDAAQQGRNSKNNTAWTPIVVNADRYDPGMVKIENVVVHRPNFLGGVIADAPLDDTRLGLVPRYLGYAWKAHGTLVAKLPMDASFATPADPWSLWRPQAGSPAIGSATGLVAHDDLLGRVRPAQASRGAVEPA